MSVYQLKPNEAVVVFMRTPPSVRYFGFTQYLYTRAGTPLFASMSDTLNLLWTWMTDGSYYPDVFNKYAVLIWAADKNTVQTIKNVLASLGVLSVNVIPIPYSLPVFMGTDPSADTFGLLVRAAVPTSQALLDAWREETPFYAVKVTPAASRAVAPLPAWGYWPEAGGVVEGAALQSALNNLASAIKTNLSSTYSLSDVNVFTSLAKGLDCIAANKNCEGDNHDALYIAHNFGVPFQLPKLNDIVVVMGINHQKIGKSIYISHAVVKPDTQAGVASVVDPNLTQASALYFAGISPNDPRAFQYKNLYAYAISYDCTGIRYCLTIPTDQVSKMSPGDPFLVVSRIYANPVTYVRPDPNEIVTQQAIVGLRR